MALVLGIAATLNLVTNIGVPTLIIRGFRQGASRSYLLALARSYILMSLLAGLGTSGVVWIFTDMLALSALGGGLALFQSLHFGVEYWLLGASIERYDRFLRNGALVQAASSVVAPAVLVCSKDIELAVFALATSFAMGSVVSLKRGGLNVRALIGLSLMVRLWWRNAAGLGLVTALAGLLYSVDILIVRILANDQLVDYRLAMYGITFLVALLPLNLFVLADAASGMLFRPLRMAQLAGLCVLASVVCSGVLVLIPQYQTAGGLLFMLAGVAGARLVTQVQVSQLNAQGRQRATAKVLAIGLAGWGCVAGNLWLLSASVWSIAIGQVLVESMVAALLFAMGSRSRQVHAKAGSE